MSHGLAYRAGLTYLAGGVPGHEPQSIVRWNGTFYRWSGVCHRPASDEEIKSAVTRWLARHPAVRTRGQKAQEVTEAFIRDVMLPIKSETEVSSELQPGTWLHSAPAGVVGPCLATPGGILDLGRLHEPTLTLLENSSEFFTLTALPVTPDPESARTTWERFLAETFEDNLAAITLMQEAFGYCLWPTCLYERMFLFLGDGNTGKSTVVETLQGVLGESNVSSISLERLGGRFDLAGLVGKLANIVFDAADADRAAEGTLKTLVSGEPVPVEDKHKPIRTMRLAAKHFIVANVLPRFHDTSDGMWRRLVLLPFARVCSLERRDPTLKARLRDELPGIAYWTLQGLSRLLSQGCFSIAERDQELVAAYRKESNPVAVFLDSCCQADPDGRVGRRTLYAAYRSWARENGFVPVSVVRFNRELRALIPQPEGESRDTRGGDRLFMGLTLRDNNDIAKQIKLMATEHTAQEGA
jgi:putative DNA primase/helicase